MYVILFSNRIDMQAVSSHLVGTQLLLLRYLMFCSCYRCCTNLVGRGSTRGGCKPNATSHLSKLLCLFVECSLSFRARIAEVSCHMGTHISFAMYHLVRYFLPLRLSAGSRYVQSFHEVYHICYTSYASLP